MLNLEQQDFKQASIKALQDEQLQVALAQARGGFVDKRRSAVDNLPEFDQIKAAAKQIKDHTLSHLAGYLEEFERNAQAAGAVVHWARTPEQMNRAVLDICARVGARSVAKGKSMISEETELNDALSAAGYKVTETDLGEYIIQLAEEKPSHIIAPAVHKTRQQVEALFAAHHGESAFQRDSREGLVAEAREQLRAQFLAADVGVTGANFLIADSGATVLVTNEGNGDLCATLPDVHIVTASIDKVIPKLAQLPTFLRLLGRSATGQEITAYTTVFSGHGESDAGQSSDQDTAKEFHIILLDNGRSDIVGGEFQDALRCIRCGACLNHCAVYGAIGGHAYGSVYPGPIGTVMTPLLNQTSATTDMVSACTMNGHCARVCPMSIPLPDLIRKHRENAFERKWNSGAERAGLKLWAAAAARPKFYRLMTATQSVAIRAWKSFDPKLGWVPGFKDWRAQRAMPVLPPSSFQRQYKHQNRQRNHANPNQQGK